MKTDTTAITELATLNQLRSQGWSVAVHNDYRLSGKPNTFWLFTHADTGRFVKGEGESDEVALAQCLEASLAAIPDLSELAGELAEDVKAELHVGGHHLVDVLTAALQQAAITGGVALEAVKSLPMSSDKREGGGWSDAYRTGYVDAMLKVRAAIKGAQE